MGKITDALKKAAEEKVTRLDRISRIKEHDRVVVRRMEGSNIDPRLVAYFDAKSPITEQYKILMSNLLSMNKGKPPKAIGVTSSIHSEGKTITAMNLAVAMAQAVKQPKVLLIDGDLRRGKIHKYLGTEKDVGLSDVLAAKAKLEEALFKIDLDNLAVLSSGMVPHNPVELLSSQKMKDLISDLRRKYDHIIIDTPPLISVADPGIIGAHMDGVLLVVQAGRTQRGMVDRATELLHQAHVNLLGYTLVNVEYHLPEYIYRYL